MFEFVQWYVTTINFFFSQFIRVACRNSENQSLRIRIDECSCNSYVQGEPARSSQSSLLEGAWSRRSRRTSPLSVSWRGVRGANWQLPSCRRLIRHHRNRSSVEIEIVERLPRSWISSVSIYERIKLTRSSLSGNLSSVLLNNNIPIANSNCTIHYELLRK